jgi:hypothetical protein
MREGHKGNESMKKMTGPDEWSMVNGQWAIGNGQWSMVDGRWSMVNGQWSRGATLGGRGNWCPEAMEEGRKEMK